MKYLGLKVGQLRQARRPGGTVAQTDKQLYSVCCLNGQIFKGLNNLHVNNMKIMSRVPSVVPSTLPTQIFG